MCRKFAHVSQPSEPTAWLYGGQSGRTRVEQSNSREEGQREIKINTIYLKFMKLWIDVVLFVCCSFQDVECRDSSVVGFGCCRRVGVVKMQNNRLHFHVLRSVCCRGRCQVPVLHRQGVAVELLAIDDPGKSLLTKHSSV